MGKKSRSKFAPTVTLYAPAIKTHNHSSESHTLGQSPVCEDPMPPETNQSPSGVERRGTSHVVSAPAVNNHREDQINQILHSVVESNRELMNETRRLISSSLATNEAFLSQLQVTEGTDVPPNGCADLSWEAYRLPIYSGERDWDAIHEWISKLEAFFEATDKIDKQRILYATHHMTGLAHAWWRSIIYQVNKSEREPVTRWDEFKTSLTQFFLPANHTDDILAEWDRLKQNDMTVKEYEEQFVRLHVKFPEKSEQSKIDKFIAGLHEAIGFDVRLRRPHTLKEAVKLAAYFEDQFKEKLRAKTLSQSVSPGLGFSQEEIAKENNSSLHSETDVLLNTKEGKANRRNRKRESSTENLRSNTLEEPLSRRPVGLTSGNAEGFPAFAKKAGNAAGEGIYASRKEEVAVHAYECVPVAMKEGSAPVEGVSASRREGVAVKTSEEHVHVENKDDQFCPSSISADSAPLSEIKKCVLKFGGDDDYGWWLKGKVMDCNVSILYSSKFPDNFISARLVKKLKLRTEECKPFRLENAGVLEDKVYNHTVRGLYYRIENIRDRADFFVIDMDRNDILFGLPWLIKIGARCYFGDEPGDRTIEIEYKGKRVEITLLQGRPRFYS